MSELVRLGTCSQCGGDAEQGARGSWWHARYVSVCRRTGGVAEFVPAEGGEEVPSGTYRWCKACDVKWWGGPDCWNCGATVPASYKLYGTLLTNDAVRLMESEGGPAE